MCCNHGLISRIPTTPLPLVSPRTHFPIRTTIHIIPQKHLESSSYIGARSFKTKTHATKGGKALISEPGIMDELSFYELLGIPETVTSVEIKQAYKQLALKYHPDVSPPDRVEEYTQRFIRVQEAYETLSDPNRRALYDQNMAMGIGIHFRNRVSSDEKMKEKSEWRGLWQSQLSELRRRSMHKESGKNASWAARMRMQRNESPS
ncbi:DnaJ domain-containing protein [Artemisia annua]|nr:DnaJ domain-containing protein [Artemisia annua]